MRNLLLALCVLALALPASADTVTLKDGRTFEGKITLRTRSKLVIETALHGIQTTLTFRMHEVESFEDTEDDDLPEKAERPERDRPEPRQRRPEPREFERPDHYLVVPIEGVFGEAVHPDGVRQVIRAAERRGVDHIVFHIDSPGGFVWAADEIAKVIADRPGGMKCYAVVEDAISAAIWVAFSCERIFIREDGSIGAAVAYRQDTSTGAVEVDAKFNSALAAKLASIARTNGHSPDLVRAMVIYEASAYAHDDGEGGYRITDRAHDEAETLDTEDSVLTLGARDVERLGVGEIYEGSIEELGERLGVENWELLNAYGERAMETARREWERENDDRAEVTHRITRLALRIKADAEHAVQNDPRNGSYTYYEDSGQFTGASAQEWRDRTDRAIKAWRRVQQGLRDLRSLQDEAEDLGVGDLEVAIDFDGLQQQASRHVQRLERERTKSGL